MRLTVDTPASIKNHCWLSVQPPPRLSSPATPVPRVSFPHTVTGSFTLLSCNCDVTTIFLSLPRLASTGPPRHSPTMAIATMHMAVLLPILLLSCAAGSPASLDPASYRPVDQGLASQENFNRTRRQVRGRDRQPERTPGPWALYCEKESVKLFLHTETRVAAAVSHFGLSQPQFKPPAITFECLHLYSPFLGLRPLLSSVMVPPERSRVE